MPADSCLVTVRAGPAASKGYENFVANKLKDEVLKEITSNLQDDLKEEALNGFKDSVKDGYSIKDCIFKVQNDVLPRVPNERNKFYIKFTYDNQLQIEIGVNKFKNGNAQFYHKIGVAPKETPEIKEHKEEQNKRKETMKELKSGIPAIKLKRQVTNDKSSPLVSGKVSNPHGGWDDAPESDINVAPNPTNMQTQRALTGWSPEAPCQVRSSRPRALGDVFIKQKPNVAKLRCRSVGRPKMEQFSQNSPEDRDRSISPLAKRGRIKGALGDCFQTGIRPTKAMLRPAGSPAAVRRTSFKTDRTESSAGSSVNQNESENVTNNMMKHIKIQVEHPEDEWDDNCVEIEEISSSEEDTENEKHNDGSDAVVSCEEKESIFITEADPIPTYNISYPSEHDFKKIDTPFQEEYPIQNLRRFNLPDQSLFSKKISPLPPLEDFNGWHGPVIEKTRTVPSKCFGKLEVSCKVQPTETKLNTLQRNGWVSIPIQRF